MGKFLTIPQIARFLGSSEARVYQMIAWGAHPEFVLTDLGLRWFADTLPAWRAFYDAIQWGS